MKVYVVFYYHPYNISSSVAIICSTVKKAEAFIRKQSSPGSYSIKEYTLDTYTELVKQEVKI